MEKRGDLSVDRIAVLENRIHEYSWGSNSFIPELLGELSPAKRPMAEMWMGTHPGGPSMAVYKNERVLLEKLIGENPSGILGDSIARKFSNKLPFLFKVIAMARPLSMQAHPNREQAKAGFLRENMGKKPMDRGDRNYRDDNHKPELICALRPLWALKGFRDAEKIIDIIERLGVDAELPAAEILRKQPGAEGLKGFFIALMDIERDRRQNLLGGIAAKIEDSGLSIPEYEWIRSLSREYPGDMGVISPLFLNLVRLRPTEAMYIHPGELHSYLEGAGLELMANSDNVIRGGLTYKHIDPPELISILDFNPRIPDILTPEGIDGPEKFYPVSAEEFMLSVISLRGKGETYESRGSRGAEIMICTDGDARVTDIGHDEILEFRRGMSIFIPASVERYLIRGETIIYRASVPL
jgi:mannose-6-phosphate isomerase